MTSNGWSKERICKSYEIIKNIELLHPYLKFSLLKHITEINKDTILYEMLRDRVGIDEDEFRTLLTIMTFDDKSLVNDTINSMLVGID